MVGKREQYYAINVGHAPVLYIAQLRVELTITMRI